jgi:hypothetical protein
LVVHGVAFRLLVGVDDGRRNYMRNAVEEGDSPVVVVDDPVVVVAEQYEVV